MSHHDLANIIQGVWGIYRLVCLPPTWLQTEEKQWLEVHRNRQEMEQSGCHVWLGKKRGSFVKSLPSGWLQMDCRLCDTRQKESQCRVFSFGVRGGRGNEDIFECMHCSRRVCRSIDLQLGCMPAEAPSSPLTVPRRAAGELCCVSDTNTDGFLSKYYPEIHQCSFLFWIQEQYTKEQLLLYCSL